MSNGYLKANKIDFKWITFFDFFGMNEDLHEMESIQLPYFYSEILLMSFDIEFLDFCYRIHVPWELFSRTNNGFNKNKII